MTTDSPSGYLFECSLPNSDMSARDGIRRIHYIAIALSEKDAFKLVSHLAPNTAGLKRIDYGEAVLMRARELGIPDGEARKVP
jgi:hypothetical protein